MDSYVLDSMNSPDWNPVYGNSGVGMPPQHRAPYMHHAAADRLVSIEQPYPYLNLY